MATFKTAIAVFLIVVFAGCSVPDSSDKSDLETAIRTSPALPSLVERMISDKQVRYLATRPGNDRVAWMRCYGANGSPYEPELLVGDVIGEMIASGAQFLEAVDNLLNGIRDTENTAGGKPCEKNQYDFRYIGDTAPDELKDRDPRRIGVAEVAEWLINLPAPLPGLALTPELLVVLCALTNTWSCPEDPNYPGQPQQPTTPGDHAGDAP